MKEILSKSIAIIVFFFLFNIFFSFPAHADMIIPFMPKGPEYLFRILAFNFSGNFLILYLVSHFYLKINRLIQILVSSFVVTIIGGIIDIVTFILSTTVPWHITTQTKLPDYYAEYGFYITFFILCFLLLMLMYKIIFVKIIKISDKKKSWIASAITAIFTHPLVFFYFIIVFFGNINKDWMNIFYNFIYGKMN